MQSESAATPSRVTYEDAPSPTMHLRSRCEWRAATGHRCELEPHGADVPHRVTLSDGATLVCAYSRGAYDTDPAQPSVEERLCALEYEAKRGGCDGACASGVDAENAHSALDAAGVYGTDEEGNDLPLAARVELLVAARLDALERKENCDGCAGARMRGSTLAETRNPNHPAAGQPLAGTVCRPAVCGYQTLVAERDSALAQCAAAVQAGEALRIECDALTAQLEWQEARANKFHKDAEDFACETSAMRVGICKALGMAVPTVYPADAEIVQAVTTMAAGRCTAHEYEWCPDAQREIERLNAEILEAGDQLRDEQRERERLRAQLSVIGKGLIERERSGGGRARPCCERDHDKDGNCDKHPTAQPMPRKES